MDIKVRLPQLFKRDSDGQLNVVISERLDRYMNEGIKETPLSPRPITRAARQRPDPTWWD